jgi:hypothetical protein
MKIIKGLLLGSAAGIVAAGGAQAADLPVVAKPVEYVKVCNLYGEGFFYIPGTETCLKIGGWVRFEAAVGDGPGIFGPAGFNDRTNAAGYTFLARTVVTLDARTQTEFGMLRSYIRAGFQQSNSAFNKDPLYAERAFIQFAGFTVGKAQSYFDFMQGTFSFNSFTVGGGSSTLQNGTLLAAYTANFGPGLSATISVEDSNGRRNALWDATGAGNPLVIGAFPGPTGFAASGFSTCGPANVVDDRGAIVAVGCGTGDYAAQQVPDIVANVRVDQGWGSAQVAAAAHQIRAGFFGNNTLSGNPTFTGQAPGDRWGWAVMGGVVLNLPWNRGDKFWVEGGFSQGAPSYVGLGQNGQTGVFQRFSGNRVAAGWALDGIFANNPLTPNSDIALPTAWDVAAAVEHYWTPAVRTSVFSQYTMWTPGAAGNQIMCSSPGSPVRTLAGAAPDGTAALPGCDFGFSVWAVGSRTVWQPVKNLDVGVEVMYSEINQKMDPNQVLYNFGGNGGRAAGNYTPGDNGAWSGTIRLQRNFNP